MTPRYRIYTKPDCPHCIRAKTLLEQKAVPFEAISLDTDEARTSLLSQLGGWRTFPAIFELDAAGKPIRFVGGADALQQAVAGG